MEARDVASTPTRLLLTTVFECGVGMASMLGQLGTASCLTTPIICVIHIMKYVYSHLVEICSLLYQKLATIEVLLNEC